MRHLGWTVCLILVLAASGCSAAFPLGKWSIVDVDVAGDRPAQLPNEKLRERYSGKYLEFTKEEPHTFLVPVPYEGTVRGCINGAWMHDPRDKQVVNVYRWVSGHVYELWGRASLKNGTMEVVIVGHGNSRLELVRE
jgi:hypothetical protein